MEIVTVTLPACPVCKERPLQVQGRCRRCHEYLKRTGRERPTWLVPKRTYCKVCNDRLVLSGGRCARCRTWLVKHGFERPTTLPDISPTSAVLRCRNGCQRAPTARGRCMACYRYLLRNGREREVR